MAAPLRRPEAAAVVAPHKPGSSLKLNERQLGIMRDLQDELYANGITADVPELVQAMLEAMTRRPRLCKGLIAAYLMHESD